MCSRAVTASDVERRLDEVVGVVLPREGRARAEQSEAHERGGPGAHKLTGPAIDQEKEKLANRLCVCECVCRMRPGGEGACVTTLLEMPSGAQRQNF